MKRYFLIIVLLVLQCSSYAQKANNEWINYGGQQYYKFPVAKDGIYKITAATLSIAGITIGDPHNIQIFGRGEEQYIHVEGEDDGIFDPNDYILVYGRKNDGFFDTLMYDNQEDMVNPYYSLINDTIYYFLTTNNSLNNKRYLIETASNYNAFTPSPYFYHEQIQSYFNQYCGGITTSMGTNLPKYVSGEGWVGPTIFRGGSFKPNFSTPNFDSTGGKPTISASIVGLTNDGGTFGDHKLQISYNNTLLVDTIYEGHAMLKFDLTVPSSQWNYSSDILFKSDASLVATVDRSAVGYVKLRYSRKYDLDNATNFKMQVPNGNNNKAYLLISNFNAQNTPAWIFDLSNNIKIPVKKNGSQYQALVGNSVDNLKDCFLTSEADFINVSTLETAVSTTVFEDFEHSSNTNTAGAFDYYIITTKELKNEAKNYQTYRNLTGYKVAIIDIEELYMQYGLGIRKHPMAIRSFARDIIKNWGQTPKYFFLVGKSVQSGFPDSQSNSNSVNNSSRSANYKNNLVPTFGYPGSDVYLTATISDTSLYDPDIAIGRISVQSSSELADYLQKVKDYESNTADYWMKRVLHFGGGTDQDQGDLFASYLNAYKNTIEGVHFGGKVNTYLKNTTDPLQLNVSDSIRTNITNGSSIMTFFGHAYGTGFDQNIDAPATYDNYKKYPLIIANSCLIGNIHQPTKASGSEDWVIIKDRGAIGFLASVSLGIPGPLDSYSSNFYRNLGKDMYGKGLGSIMRQTIHDVEKNGNIFNDDDPYIQDVCMMMTLQADPAIVLNAHLKPDYTIYGSNGTTQPTVETIPKEISTTLNSFKIELTISNIGQAVDDSMSVQIIRVFPNGKLQDSIYIVKIPSVLYQTKLTFEIPVDLINGVGLNTFKILVDSENKIAELSEINNSYDLVVDIKSSALNPIYPYNYAIVPTPSVVLKASTNDPFAPSRKYVMQIDTNKSFTSPTLYETIEKGGVIEWDPKTDQNLSAFFSSFPNSTTLAQPTVFYWRVSPDSSYTHQFSWKNSSFQYVTGKTGWGQAHFGQFNEDDFSFISPDTNTKSFSFFEHVRKLEVLSTIQSKNYLSLDGSQESFWKMVHNTPINISTDPLIQVSVIDHKSLKPWETNKKPFYGQINEPGNSVTTVTPFGDKNFWFQSYCNNGGYFKGINDLIDAINDSDFVAIYTFGKVDFKNTFTIPNDGPIFKQKLDNLLGANVDSLEKNGNCSTGTPYILIAQKGNPTFATEAFAPNAYSVKLSKNLRNNGISGNIYSPIIGPVKHWNSLYWETKTFDAPHTKDTIAINVYGIKDNLEETLLHTFIEESGSDLRLDTIVDSTMYTYVRLEAYLADDSMHTPLQFKRWQIVHDEMMEIAINPHVKFSLSSDSIQEGNKIQMEVAFTNVSQANADDIQVAYWFTDASLTSSTKKYIMLPALKADSTYIHKIDIPTIGLTGANRFWYEINPFSGGPKAWQREQHHFNNLLDFEFKVYSDKINPLLDVVFDGIHILNGDIVSPKSVVTIQVKDENQFLALDDENLFHLFILYPDEKYPKPLVKGEYKFDPATLPDNKSKITINEKKENYFDKEGHYVLMIQAVDKSKNKSGLGDGTYDYRIEFEIVNRSEITAVLNYPNPFTTSTQFVFTLTGSELPDDFRIEIMNITGKMVKEITLTDLGDIHIGRNITKYKWDGTDNFGDPLANGLYLYRVIAKINGKDIDNREVNVSSSQGGTQPIEQKYFKEGFGKLYIMR